MNNDNHVLCIKNRSNPKAGHRFRSVPTYRSLVIYKVVKMLKDVHFEGKEIFS